MINYRLEREQLVDGLYRRGIRDKRVLDALRQLKRHIFLPSNLRGRAYEDTPLPIGENQTISQPFMVAKMTELLELKGDEKVLEIGTGSGYQCALLAMLAKKVFTVERITTLAERSREIFAELELDGRIIQKVGDGSLGWPEFAPFDRIMVTAGAPHVPQKMVEQLGDGGILVVPSGTRRIQDLKKVIKKDNEVITSSEGGCVFVPLVGSEGWKGDE